MNDWINAPEDIEKYIGFVYKITNLKNDKFYIGQKKFWSERKLKPLKGKKRCRHTKTESKWRNYWGSSKDLLEDIKKYGKECFKREILIKCYTKGLMNFHETKIQFDKDVLFNNNSYNKIINCRISSNMMPEYMKYD